MCETTSRFPTGLSIGHALQTPAYNEWQRQQQAKVNLNQPVGVFKDLVLAWPQRLPDMDVEVKALPSFVFPDGAHRGWGP
jgi:hypothetical protein